MNLKSLFFKQTLIIRSTKELYIPVNVKLYEPPSRAGGLPIIIIITLLAFTVSAHAVPVMTNKAVIEGTVSGYCLESSAIEGIRPEQVLYKIVISVEEVMDVEDYPNFLRDKKGESVIFYSKFKQPPEIFGKRIKAVVEYKGDERGGLFWIKALEVIK
ncbi:MAG: hypothetical protein AAB257_07280 [Nitrospinota bacterium]